MNKIVPAIDLFFEKAESYFGRFTIAIFTGLVFLILAGSFYAVRYDTFYHGNGFARLSLHPFEMQGENDLRFRILSPLMGYILFMRGTAFKFFMLLVLAMFFAVVYFSKRKEFFKPTEALGITALLVFSTLAFYQLYFPAYTDPTSFLLILLFMMFYKNIKLATLFIGLMLFNHENTVFLFPFFFLLLLNGEYNFGKILRTIIPFIVAAIPYIIYRKFIASHAEVNFTTSYYFNPGGMKWTREHVFPHLVKGVFHAFRFAWLIPAAAFIIDLYEKRYNEIVLLGVIFIFVLLQLAIAWDISRLVGLSFPVILIGAARLRQFFGTQKFLLIIYSIIIINFLTPAYCIGALDPISYSK
jgi:hypothetical protein